jgi:hypothetical protein
MIGAYRFQKSSDTARVQHLVRADQLSIFCGALEFRPICFGIIVGTVSMFQQL